MSVYHELRKRWELRRKAFPDCSYYDFDIRVRQKMAWLRAKGLERGEHLCVQLPKSQELLELILASMALGCPVLPLNEKYTEQEIRFYLNDSEAKLAILLQKARNWDGQILSAQEAMNASEYSPEPLSESIDLTQQALFLYTSGTTGHPKGAMISHANILACLKGLHEAWQWSPEDKLLHVLPLFHVHGLIVAQFGALYANAQTILEPSFDAHRAVLVLKEENISICMAVPTIHYRLLQVENIPELPALRLLTSGSAPLPVAIHEKIRERFGIGITERYGMTEVGIVLSNPYPQGARPGTVGFPVGDARFKIMNSDGEECSIGQIGELWIKGSSVIQAYWNRPKQTEESITDGWLHSGDLACLDSDGYYSIVGRAKDLIISGGFNVYPKEIENLLLKIKSLKEVAVIGVPDEEWGERVIALLIGSAEEAELKQFCQANLASYKRPKKYIFVDDFPRNAMGKIQKAKLREIYGEKKLFS